MYPLQDSSDNVKEFRVTMISIEVTVSLGRPYESSICFCISLRMESNVGEISSNNSVASIFLARKGYVFRFNSK